MINLFKFFDDPLQKQGSSDNSAEKLFPFQKIFADQNIFKDWQDYVTDSYQRSVLVLDTLRRSGNEQKQITSETKATVLHFDYEEIMNGRSQAKPFNYFLLRIKAPDGIKTDPEKRPIVVIDPRAGQGPGIGGFKHISEVGDALKGGHPVYFIGFTADPVPGQTFPDVVEGQVKFFEKIKELHPNAPLPMAIGNCQAGYQTFMVAMLRPDLFGICMAAGSPMSYLQGVRGKNPMRYSGGLALGSWATALLSDLGNGRFDGSWLILNFDNLNPANWLWGKQYYLYADIDEDAQRYLDFERWWGDFILLNGEEIQYLVDELFIGDKLARNQLKSSEGVVFDFRNITAPIVILTSEGDNISPPQQTLGWIADLYRDVDEIRAEGKTIVYCVDPKVGHLAIFVSSKIGGKEDEEILRLADMIDCLPPGLFEIVITENPDKEKKGKFGSENWITRFEMRTLDDIRAFGRNSEADDRAFAAVQRVSETTRTFYEEFVRPWVKPLMNEQVADMLRTVHPLRLGYSLFTDANPFMTGIASLAEEVNQNRQPVGKDNPFWQVQQKISDQINSTLDSYREFRDRMSEACFYAIYQSPPVQVFAGSDKNKPVRDYPGLTPEKIAARKALADSYSKKVKVGCFNEALVRIVLYIRSAEHGFDERAGEALADLRRQMMHITLAELKQIIRDQSRVLYFSRGPAIDALPVLVPDKNERIKLLEAVQQVIEADGKLTAKETTCLNRVRALFAADKK